MPTPHSRDRRPGSSRPSAQGFTLIELLITMAIMVIVLVGVLNLFDFTNNLTRVQIHMTEMQQSLRIGQHHLVTQVRMAGRGGLAPAPPLVQTGFGTPIPVHQSPSIDVRNNVGDGGTPREVAIGIDEVLAVQGTDILTIRGVLSTSTLVVDYKADNVFSFVPGAPSTGTVTIGNTTPGLIPQNLQPLRDAIAAGTAESIVLVSALNPTIYGVAQLDPANSVDNADNVVLAFIVDPVTELLSFDRAFPTMEKVGFVGILEEYRYFVREVFDDAPGTDEPAHRLAQARMFPGTENPYAGNNANLQIDIADNIFDLQVALGFDSAVGGSFADDDDNDGDDDRVLEAADGANDDWLFNGIGDDAAAEPWAPPLGADWDDANPRPRLFWLRLSTLARTDRPDRRYVAPVIDELEDHVYGTDSADPINGELARKFRRRSLQTLIDLRNLG